MIIKTLYKPGDKVWIVGSTPVTKDCPDCGGEGSLETKTGTYQACQLCRGSGEVITREVFTALPKPLEIQCVRAHINRGQANQQSNIISKTTHTLNVYVLGARRKPRAQRRNGTLIKQWKGKGE